ncbi:MAG: FAD:protein FMN transferase [Candidatus Binatia bacterium]
MNRWRNKEHNPHGWRVQPWHPRSLSYFRLLPFALCLLPFTFLLPPAAADTCLSDGRYTMGTVLEITLCGSENSSALSDKLFTAVNELDAQLTTYSAESPVSRLNAQAGHNPMPVPLSVTDVLQLSQRYWRLTNGTFDVTVGPLMQLWRQAATRDEAPLATAIQKTRSLVDSGRIRFLTDGAVFLPRPGMRVDLGGIGKGYALDQLVLTLKQQAVRSALLDFGQSSIWAVGAPPDAPGWRLLIQQPNGRPAGVITLRDQALSISASMSQPLAIQGKRYGHVVDPRNGRPIQRDLQACVLAPTAALAEALSKALLILGEQQGVALLQGIDGVEGLLLDTNGQRWMTPGWKRATAFVPLS